MQTSWCGAELTCFGKVTRYVMYVRNWEYCKRAHFNSKSEILDTVYPEQQEGVGGSSHGLLALWK